MITIKCDKIFSFLLWSFFINNWDWIRMAENKDVHSLLYVLCLTKTFYENWIFYRSLVCIKFNFSHESCVAIATMMIDFRLRHGLSWDEILSLMIKMGGFKKIDALNLTFHPWWWRRRRWCLMKWWKCH